MIVAIGAWVLGEACRQARAWQDAGLPPLVVAVNLSAMQSKRPDLVSDPDDAAIVRAIIQMARSLKLKTIAEGVESEEPTTALQNLSFAVFGAELDVLLRLDEFAGVVVAPLQQDLGVGLAVGFEGLLRQRRDALALEPIVYIPSAILNWRLIWKTTEQCPMLADGCSSS